MSAMRPKRAGKSLVEKLESYNPSAWVPRPEILVRPSLPLPMHGLAPRVVLGDQWWNETRYAAYRSTNFHCIICSVCPLATSQTRRLEGHELYDIDYLLGRMTYVETVPVCSWCHGYIHPGYLKIQRDEGIIPIDRYNAILEAGTNVIRKNNLQISSRDCTGPTVDWKEWRLVVFGNEYPPIYPDYNAYLEAYRR